MPALLAVIGRLFDITARRPCLLPRVVVSPSEVRVWRLSIKIIWFFFFVIQHMCLDRSLESAVWQTSWGSYFTLIASSYIGLRSSRLPWVLGYGKHREGAVTGVQCAQTKTTRHVMYDTFEVEVGYNSQGLFLEVKGFLQFLGERVGAALVRPPPPTRTMYPPYDCESQQSLRTKCERLTRQLAH